MSSNLPVPTFGFWSAGQKAARYLSNPSVRSRLRATMSRSEGKQRTDVANAALTAGAPLNLSVQEWCDLFRAIQERLRRVVADRNTGTACLQMHHMGGSIQDAVLECVAALDQLHAALALERERVNSPGKVVDALGRNWARRRRIRVVASSTRPVPTSRKQMEYLDLSSRAPWPWR